MKTGHMYSYVKLNFKVGLFSCNFYLRPSSVVFLAYYIFPFLQGKMAKISPKINKIKIWPKYIHETEAVEAIFGECLNYKSDLRILIFPLKVPFSGIKDGHFWRKLTVFGPRKNGTSSGRIKIKILQFKHSPNMAYTPLIS